jgi:cytoskeletal protein CcmA (bactofilin family)
MAEDQGAFIAQGTQIRGRIYGDADLVVEGSLEGSISLSKMLIVEAGGNVEAESEASQIEVRGQLGGNAKAHDLIALGSSSTVTATLRAPRIIVEEGARVVATFDMDVELPPGVSEDFLQSEEQ